MTYPNEPIYPIIDLGVNGLTKREYFAGLAMQGLVNHFVYNYNVDAEKLAAVAVKMADALIAELNKTNP